MPRRSRYQREMDLAKLAELEAKQMRRYQQAEILGVTMAQVHYDLEVLKQRWRESALMDSHEATQRELARLDVLEREAWEAWERSKQPATEELAEQTTSAMTPGQTKAALRTKQRDGNPAFLTQVFACIDRRIKLLGLDPRETPDYRALILVALTQASETYGVAMEEMREQLPANVRGLLA